MERSLVGTGCTSRPVLSKGQEILVVLVVLAVGIGLGAVIYSPAGEAVFALVGNAVLALLIFVNPILGMLLWLTMIPFSSHFLLDLQIDRVPDVGPLRIGAVLLLSVLLGKAAVGKMKLSWHRLDTLVVVATLGIGVSILDSASLGQASSVFLNAFVVPFALYYTSRSLVVGLKEMRAVVRALLVIALYLSFLAIFEQVTGITLFDPGLGFLREYSSHVRRISSLLGNPAFFGAVFGMIAPFVLYLSATEKERLRKYAYLGVFLVVVLATYFTVVRGAWLGLLVGVLVCAVTNSDARKVVVGMMLFGALTVSVGWGMVEESFVYQERVTSEGPVDSRLVLYATTWSMIADHPVRGVGLGNFKAFSSYYLTSWGDIPGSIGQVEVTPHNTSLWILTSSGLLGFLPYLAVLLGILLSTLRHVGPARRGSREHWLLLGSLWGAWAAFFVNGSFIDLVYFAFGMAVFFVICGSVLGVLDRARYALGRESKPSRG